MDATLALRPDPAQPVATVPITLTINGQQRAPSVEPWTTLLDLLREGERLTGAKKSCDHGQTIGKQLLKAAASVDGKPLGKASIDEVEFAGGRIVLKSNPSVGVSITKAMRAAIQAEETATPGIGGVATGIGMALHEGYVMNTRIGRFMNHTYADHHIPAHAGIHDIEVIFVGEPEAEVTPPGVKGLGEIGIVATAAVVANAIFHATGKRVRSLPITIDKLLTPEHAG